MSITIENLTLTKIDDMLEQAFNEKRLDPECLYVAEEDKKMLTDIVVRANACGVISRQTGTIATLLNGITGHYMQVICPPNHPKGIISFSGDREVNT
jgi:hypothetical protein